MRALNFTIIKLLFSLIVGIVLAYYNPILSTYSPYFLSVTVIVFIICYFLFLNNSKKKAWFGLSTLFLLIGIGLFSYHINDDRSYNHHYLNVNLSNCFNSSSLLTLQIDERLKSSKFHHKYVADLITVDRKKVSGKILFNVRKDSSNNILQTNDIIAVNAILEELPKPLNPYQFNYGFYLQQSNIFKQIFADYKSIVVTHSGQVSLSRTASLFRAKINIQLKKAGYEGNELSVINALILGQRQDIDQELYSSYAKAGVVHILAVSGLHIGIILLFLNQIFKPILYFRYGKLIKPIIIVLLLWCFAIIASLSPSITRAVTMFSIFAIAMHLKRPTNAYNTLAISALILLLIDPKNLFKVGFQMSYFAVLSILFFQPLLYRLWRPKLWLFKHIWSILTVTVAAQIGVLPISVYYFHQIPGLFFIANLLIIPFLGLILGIGILTIVLAMLNSLPVWLMEFYKSLIQAMNSFVQFIANQKDYQITNISLDLIEVIALYIFIVGLGVFIVKRTFKRLIQLLFSILLIQSVLIILKYKHNDQNFVIFHKSKETIIGIAYNSSLRVYSNQDNYDKELPKCITDYLVGNHIKDVLQSDLRSVFVYRNTSILIIDSTYIQNVARFQPNYILLRNSPRINLNRLIDSLVPQCVIADGSNYKTYVERWKETCLKRKLPFHYTGEKGAFILK